MLYTYYMQHLYFVRHGQSVLNVEGKFAGRIDTPLTAEGRKQARAAGRLLKQTISIDAIVSSPLGRALETAQIIAKEIAYPPDAIHISKLFVERDFGSLEGKPYSPDLNLDGFSDIETKDTLIERVHLGLRWLETLDADTVLVVGHGSYGRALRTVFHPDIDFEQRIPNADIMHLQ